MSIFNILRYPPKQRRCIQFYGLKFRVCIMQKNFILTVLLTGLSSLLYGQLVISPTTLPDGTYGGTYNQQLTESGGTGLGLVYTYSLDPSSLPLPPGLSLSASGVISGTPAAAGPYTFTVDVSDLFFETGSQNISLTIDPAVLTVTANNATGTYGSALPVLGVSYNGFVNGDDATSLTTAPTAATTATASSPAGSYTITPGGGVSSNYTFNYVNGTLTINPVPLTITANDASMVYGGTVPVLSASYTGFVNGDHATSLTTPPTLTTTAASTSPAGNYPITASGAVDANYTISYQSGTMSIGKATLTVTADDQSMPLGGPVPALTVSYTGFVNGDDASSLTPQPTATTTATKHSPAGTYPITPHGGSSPNYTFSYVNGTLSVGKAILTITANSATMPYGGSIPALSVSYNGFQNGDDASSLTTQPTVTTTATPSSPVGSYTTTASGAADPDYTIVYVSGTFTITPAPLTITANNGNMTYGGGVPSLSASYSGFVNGDNASSLTTAPTLATTATPTSPAGGYPIAASGAVDANYTIVYQPGIMTIGKATLIVTADSKSMPLGGPLPALTVSYVGFVNGDVASGLTTQPTATTTATAASPSGTYTITPGGGVSANYTFNYVNGTLTVAKAILIITANNATMSYGGTFPSLTISYSGFANGDDASDLTTQPSLTLLASANSPAGTYTITPSGAVDPNYSIVYVNGTFTINPVPLTIKANNASMTYGGSLPSLSATYTGFVNGDNASSLTTPPSFSTTASAASPIGTYPITPLGAVDHNYIISYQTGTMTVGKATLTVTADNKSMPLGGPLPVLTVSYSGFVNGDNASSLASLPTATTTATAASPAGAYPITPGGGSATNYNFHYVNGTLAVATAVLTITANPAGSIYGAGLVPSGSLTVSYSGFVNGDGPGSLTTQPIVTNSATASSPVGSYSLIPSGAASPNYAIQYVSGNYTISPATLTVTAVSQSMGYGNAVPPLTASYSGFVNGDNASSLTVQPTLTTTATPASPVGTYPITVSGAVDPNYNINYQGGILTVTGAVLTITPNPASMTYGGTVPALSVSYSGFINGDNASNLIVQPTISTTASAASAAGDYPITASGAADPNYTIVYEPGTLTVNAAHLLVTANAATKQYGAADPAFTYSVNGLLNGDNTSIFSGSLIRAPGEHVGTYPIAQGSLSAGGNYAIDFIPNYLTITIASQQIAWGQSLLVGCNDTTDVYLTATASSGLPVTYSVSDPTIAKVSGDTLTLLKPGTTIVTATQAGDSNYEAATAVTDTVDYASASLISQHWGDVIFFDNSSDDYVQWQWFKDGVAVKGDTSQYFSETPSLNGQYYVVATNREGQRVQSCILIIKAGAPIPGGIKVSPNPVNGGSQATITCNYPASVLPGAVLQVVDLSGRVLQQVTNVQPTMQVTMPSAYGIYIVNLLLTTGQRASVNVLVLQ
jgi:MBG domain (YGX type)